VNDITIMLVDDDSDVLDAIGARCRARGFNVLRAHNLLTAMSLVECHRPDVLCVDVQLPTGSGLSFCESLAANEMTRDIPVIVLTGQRDDETIRQCRKLGATYVAKRPDVWSELEPLLEKLIKERRHRCAARAAEPEPTRTKSVSDSLDLKQSKSPPNGVRASRGRSLPLRTIVIADDDVDLVDSLTQRCSQLGLRVIGASSALEAINAINRVVPDLVCIDVNMPAGNGLSVCEMMSSDARLRPIPVIVMTGDCDQQTIRRCHDMMVYYVQKCVDVWSRLEPLLVELLGGAAGPSATPSEHSRGKTTLVESPGEAVVEHGHDSLMDAVFAMLGSGDASEIPSPIENVPAVEIEQTSANAEPPWVLCIDDDADFSDALKCRLESYGVAVIRAYSGMEGYRMAFTHPARAILLDYNMPNGQGDYILGRLQDNRATCEIPVIVITGVRDKSLERKMYGLGAKRFLTKPVQFETLRDELAKYIDILMEPAAV
jgi:CheY-like chemotaxis protein